jgi:hypothetical protein
MPDEEHLVGKKIRLDRIYPNDLQSHFVSSIVVQHQPDAFILSFFEVWPPAVLGKSEEEKRKILESLDSVEARCVARLVVTPSKMGEFVAVMTENLENYERTMKLESELDLD